MSDSGAGGSARAEARHVAKARRAAKARLSEVVFGALAAGWSIEQIAEMRRVGPRTVRREMDRALDARRLAAPDRYAHLQVARLTKALRVADAALDRGELGAIAPMLKVVNALDRYHGGAAVAPVALEAPAFVPAALPAPLLRLTAAPKPLTPEPADCAEGADGERDFVTAFGAEALENAMPAPEPQGAGQDGDAGAGDGLPSSQSLGPDPDGTCDFVTAFGAEALENVVAAPEPPAAAKDGDACAIGEPSSDGPGPAEACDFLTAFGAEAFDNAAPAPEPLNL